MIKDHSASDRGGPLPPLHGLLFLISGKASFISTIPDRIAHNTAFVTSVVEHWPGTRNSSMGPPWDTNPRSRSPSENN